MSTLRFDPILLPPGETHACVSDPLPSGGMPFHVERLDVIVMNLAQTGKEPLDLVEVDRVRVGDHDQSWEPTSADQFAQNSASPHDLSGAFTPIDPGQTVTIWARNVSTRTVRFLPVLSGIRD